MRFNASLPDDEVNRSRTRPGREAAILVAGIGAVGSALFVVIALAIELIIPWVPPSFEAQLFSKHWIGEAVASIDAESSPRAAGVSALLERLSAHWPDNPYSLQVAIRNETMPNAFAFPGGLLVVTSGLLEGIESENELAFVLGHELGHYHNRDHLRGIGRASAFAVAMGAVGLAGDEATRLVALAGGLTSRSFDRNQESDADRFGLELVQAEYGHVAGYEDFFEQLPDPDGELQREVVHYLSTHPMSEERIETLEAFSRERGWRQDGALAPLGLGWSPREGVLE